MASRGRPPKSITEQNARLGIPGSLRKYWQEINRHDRHVQAELRAKRKARDKKGAKCRCDAYKFPHRPGGGLCRHPDPPTVRWQDAQAAEIAQRVAKFKQRFGEPNPEQMRDLIALTTRPCRKYRKRYAGILRQIARHNGLHPIRDRKLIEQLLPSIVMSAKQMKHRLPKWQYKYRNMEFIDNGTSRYGVQGIWTTAGPTM